MRLTTMRISLLFSLALATSACASQGPASEFEDLGPFLDSLMAEHGIPGAQFALFNDSGLLYEHVAGVKSQATLEPIDSETAFEAASITKPMFAHVTLSLAREGILPLNDLLHTMVEELPDVAHDPRSQLLTARLLLSHQGGLPNWRTRLDFAATNYSELFPGGDTLQFGADPGSGYHYSGEGYVLLQRVVEEVTGKGLAELGNERILVGLEMTHSSFVFDTAMRDNYSMGHDREGAPDKWELSVPLASSTLHTTAADLARFGAHVAEEIRIGGPYAALANPEVIVGAEGDAQLAWGLGLGVMSHGPRRYIYHGGNNVIFIADLIYGVEENLGYALLTNSANGVQMVEAVERRIFGGRIRR